MSSVDKLLAQADPGYRRWLDSIDDDVVAPDGVVLYSWDTLSERNATYEVAAYLPGHLLIGDDSGGGGLVIACSGVAGPVFLVGLGSMREDDFTVVSPTFETWARDKFPLPQDQPPDLPHISDVYVDQVPVGSVRVMMELNKLLGAGWRVGDLRGLLASQPFLAASAAYPWALRRKLEQAPELRPYLFHAVNGTLEPVWPSI